MTLEININSRPLSPARTGLSCHYNAMPGTKRTFAGRAVPKGYQAKRRRMVAGVMPRRAARASIAAILKSQGRKGEVKSIDGVGGNTNALTSGLNATGLVRAINLVAVGSSFFNRIGRKVEMKSLHLTGSIVPTGNAATADYGRILVVYDRQTNGALPVISDILQGTDCLGASATSNFSNVNLNNRERFLILADHRIFLPGVLATGINAAYTDSAQPVANNVNRFIKLKGLLTHYKADSATPVIGDIATGALYLVTLAGNAAGSDGWVGELNTRLRFDDT